MRIACFLTALLFLVFATPTSVADHAAGQAYSNTTCYPGNNVGVCLDESRWANSHCESIYAVAGDSHAGIGWCDLYEGDSHIGSCTFVFVNQEDLPEDLFLENCDGPGSPLIVRERVEMLAASLNEDAEALVESLDEDEDDMPDALEGQLCGREAVRNVLNEPAIPGQCASSSDYEADAPDVVDLAQDVVDIALALYHGLLDADQDFVPDAAEPMVCQVEDRNSGLDGSCEGDDYTPPIEL